MQKPLVIVFTTVPGRSRRDGWSPRLQQQFVELLAGGVGVAEAARRLGKNRQSAYALRRRAGAESFARAWDAAIAAVRSAAPAAPARLDTAQCAAAAAFGYREVSAALACSQGAARAAFSDMLHAMYGPHAAANSKSDTDVRDAPLHASRRFRRLSAAPVALENAPLKPGPC